MLVEGEPHPFCACGHVLEHVCLMLAWCNTCAGQLRWSLDHPGSIVRRLLCSDLPLHSERRWVQVISHPAGCRLGPSLSFSVTFLQPKPDDLDDPCTASIDIDAPLHAPLHASLGIVNPPTSQFIACHLTLHGAVHHRRTLYHATSQMMCCPCRPA